MFKDLYKKANENITDEALKEKILNPQPVKSRSFVPAYSYGTIIAAVIALVLFVTGNKQVEEAPVVAKNPPVKYEYKGEQLQTAKKSVPEISAPVAKTVEEPLPAAEPEVSADIATEDINAPVFVYRGRADDILYNTAAEEKSYALSPFSLESAVSVALNGADENTKNALLAAFNATDVHAQNLKMHDILRQYNTSDKINIVTANSVWINKDRTDARFIPEFETTVFNFYSAESHTVSDSQAIDSVNNWVSTHTQGKINHLISDSNFEGLIVNTVYFKGNFKNKFNKNLTKKDMFTGNNIQYERDFMEQTSYLNYGKIGETEIAELPYISDNAEISMYVIMGKERVINPVTLIESTPLESTYLNLIMPKFEYSYQTSLTPALINMGIENILLPAMAEGTFNTFDVIQKTYINTDEEGTEAAAATGMLVGAAGPGERPEPYVLKIDKDFTFVIYDKTNKVTLFAGEVK